MFKAIGCLLKINSKTTTHLSSIGPIDVAKR